MYLQKMNRRDRLRTWGGLFRNLIALIPILLVLWSAWYFVQHGDDFIEKLTKEAVKQSAAYSQDSLMEQIQQYLQKKQ